MLQRLQGGISAVHVAQCYPGLIDVLVLDQEDAAAADAVSSAGVRPVVTQTLMRDAASRKSLAEAALNAVALA
jgi:LPPG:FO 2-phospho-L-lactate transferase